MGIFRRKFKCLLANFIEPTMKCTGNWNYEDNSLRSQRKNLNFKIWNFVAIFSCFSVIAINAYNTWSTDKGVSLKNLQLKKEQN